MHRSALTTAAFSVLCAAAHAGIVYTADFNSPLNGDWVAGTPENGGSVAQGNNTLEFTGTMGPAPADGLRVRHAQQNQNTSILPTGSDWTLQVSAHIDPLSSFPNLTAQPNNGLITTLQLTPGGGDSQLDNLEINTALLDVTALGGPGVSHGFRVASEVGDVDDVQEFLFFGTNNTSFDPVLYLSYSAAAQEVWAGYDLGSGIVNLGPAMDVSGWTFGTSNFEFSLEGQMFELQNGGPVSPNFEVEPGEAYFDDLVVQDATVVPSPNVPEPGSAMLLFAGCSAFAFRRKR